MALIKEGYISEEFGVPCEYWRIVDIHVNLRYKWCDITLEGSPSQQIRFNNQYEALTTKKVRAKWTQEEFGGYFTPKSLSASSIYDKAYDYVKTHEFFKDAVDELNHLPAMSNKANVDLMKDTLIDMKYEGSAHEAYDIEQSKPKEIYPPIKDEDLNTHDKYEDAAKEHNNRDVQ